MQHWNAVRLDDQFCVQIEVKIKAPINLCMINVAGHQDISGVMIAFGFDQTSIKARQFAVNWFEGPGKHLEFFAASSFDQRTANQMIDDLVPLTFAYGVH